MESDSNTFTFEDNVFGGNTTNAPLATYEQGWDDGVKKAFEILKMWGEAACILLDFMPSKELTLPWRVSEECVLEFTVRKQ